MRRLRYLEQKQKSLTLLKNRMISAQQNALSKANHRYIGNVAKLDAMSPLKVLTRGYSMANTQTGELLRSVHQVEAGESIVVNLSDGSISATVTDKKENLE